MFADGNCRTLYVRLNIKFSIRRTRLKSTCLRENLWFLALSLLYELDKLFSPNIAFSISRSPYFVFMPTDLTSILHDVTSINTVNGNFRFTP